MVFVELERRGEGVVCALLTFSFLVFWGLKGLKYELVI